MLALFYFVFEDNFSGSTSPRPRGAYISRGDLTEGFWRYRFGGLVFGGPNTWRGLFSEFYGILINKVYLTSSFIRLFSKLKSKAIPPLSLATSS